MSAEPVPEAEPALVVEGLSKLYARRSPRWRRILLPWSRVDTGGDDLDDDEDEIDEDEDEQDLPEGDGTWALRDVSFTVGRGEVVGIVGMEGSGRTTLMRILHGLSLPTEGRALVHGRVGPSPQHAKLLLPSGATARQTLRGVARQMRAPRELVRRREAEAFELGGLPLERDRDLRKLTSIGRLRFIWASVMVLEPDVLLVEGRPFKSDPEFQQRWIDHMLAEKAARGIGVVLRIEDLNFIEQLADRVVWLDEGRVRQIGPTNEVVAAFREHRREERREHGTDVEGPLSSARIVDADGEHVTDIAAGDGLRVEADVEISDLRTLVECVLELRHEGDHAPGATQWRWRLEGEGDYTVRCTVPGPWMREGQWSGRLTITTAELHGQRRSALQDLVFTAQGGGGDPETPLDAVAEWTLAAEPAADDVV